MFCNNCKSARPENEAPCPNCGAPSSLLGQSQSRSWEMEQPVSTPWNDSTPSFNQQWNTNQALQFPQAPSWQQNPGFQQQGLPPQQTWSAYATGPAQEQQKNLPSLLPVPYTGNGQENDQQAQTQLITYQQMIPAIPGEQADTVYVPPMYTKPRPIIPTYRIISGMLSILIVSLLLCGGGIYYAQSHGTLTALARMVGTVRPPDVNPSSSITIPNPPQASDIPGPASNIITSATTTLHVIGNSSTPREQDTILQVGVPFYITFTATPPKPGNVLIKMYMNKNFYTSVLSPKNINPTAQEPTATGVVPMIYVIQATGIAQLYWVPRGGKPQLAQTLYFSVK